MKLDFYLKRSRVTLENYLDLREIKNYQQLSEVLNSIGVEIPDEKDVQHAFTKKQTKPSKRPADNANKAAPKDTGAGAGTGRSRTRGRPRKSSSSRKTSRKKAVDSE